MNNTLILLELFKIRHKKIEKTKIIRKILSNNRIFKVFSLQKLHP